MGTVVVLASGRIDGRRLRHRLNRAGYATLGGDGAVRISRDGRAVIESSGVDVGRLPERVTGAARQLLGRPPRDGLACSFAGPPGTGEEWATVIAVARAVAADVPLAVLDDLTETTYLIHPGRGLISPEEYEAEPRTTTTADVLRRLFGA